MEPHTDATMNMSATLQRNEPIVLSDGRQAVFLTVDRDGLGMGERQGRLMTMYTRHHEWSAPKNIFTLVLAVLNLRWRDRHEQA